MKASWIFLIVAGVLAAACWFSYRAGHNVASLAGAAELAKAEKHWSEEREQLATQRADAVNARLIAEQKQADAIDNAALSYLNGKDDAKQDADKTIADLDAGTRRLRDQWATCRVTSAAVAAGVPPTPGGQQPDGEAGLRKDGIRSVLRTVGECQAQRDALQQALIGERQGE